MKELILFSVESKGEKMAKSKIIKYILLISIIIIGLFVTKELFTFIKEKSLNENDSVQQNQIDQENQIIDENTLIENTEENNLIFSENLIGRLKIPKLEIDAEIKEGIDLDTLANYIGHFTNSSLWNGNVALASHNRGSSVAHYFEGIHLLDVGDEIIYITNMGERRYQVFSKKEISNTDWSVTLETEENTVTMITCITGYPEKRMCVQAKEV